MGIKGYIMGIIYIAIFGILVELIIPNNKLKKYVISIISLLVVITILTPVINILKEDNVTATIEETLEVISDKVMEKNTVHAKYDFSKYIDRTITKTTKEKIEEEFMESLKTSDINFNKIEDIKIDMSSSYVIEGITVYVKGLSSVNKAKDISNIIDKIKFNFNISEGNIKVIERGISNE